MAKQNEDNPTSQTLGELPDNAPMNVVRKRYLALLKARDHEGIAALDARYDFLALAAPRSAFLKAYADLLLDGLRRATAGPVPGISQVAESTHDYLKTLRADYRFFQEADGILDEHDQSVWHYLPRQVFAERRNALRIFEQLFKQSSSFGERLWRPATPSQANLVEFCFGGHLVSFAQGEAEWLLDSALSTPQASDRASRGFSGLESLLMHRDMADLAVDRWATEPKLAKSVTAAGLLRAWQATQLTDNPYGDPGEADQVIKLVKAPGLDFTTPDSKKSLRENLVFARSLLVELQQAENINRSGVQRFCRAMSTLDLCTAIIEHQPAAASAMPDAYMASGLPLLDLIDATAEEVLATQNAGVCMPDSYPIKRAFATGSFALDEINEIFSNDLESRVGVLEDRLLAVQCRHNPGLASASDDDEHAIAPGPLL